jgi:chemotaxis protein MotB
MLFDRSSADLKPALNDLLGVLGPILSRLGNKIQIHGHTDGRRFPAGSPKTNWSLSFERGNEARRVLEPLLRPGQIMGVYAHGDSMPASSDPLAPENRRLAILAVQNKKEPEAAAPPAPSASATPGAPAKPAEPASSGTGVRVP